MAWFRCHDGFSLDAKYKVIASRSSRSVTQVVCVWMTLLDFANQHEDRGSIEGFDVEVVAEFFGMSPEDVEAIIEAMRQLRRDGGPGMISGNRLTSWDKRQPKREDDTAAERKRRERDRKAEDAASRDVTQCHAASQPVTTDREIDREIESTSLRDVVAEPVQPALPLVDDDAKAANDPVGYSFRRLVELGINRALVGKWKQKLRDPKVDLIDIVASIERENPDNATEWFIGACKARAGPTGRKQPAPESSIWQF